MNVNIGRVAAATVFAAAIGICPSESAAQYRPAPVHRPDLMAAPCGPDWIPGPLRLLIPQGFLGAGFRSACNFHDECYYVPGARRLYCDRDFHRRMTRQCSRSAWPGGCRAVAGVMYSATRVFGGVGFSEAQRIGRTRSRFACRRVGRRR